MVICVRRFQIKVRFIISFIIRKIILSVTLIVDEDDNSEETIYLAQLRNPIAPVRIPWFI
jgi:hypothetical protein